MKRHNLVLGAATLCLLVLASTAILNAQDKQTFTGTVVSFGTGRNVRTTTHTFSLTISGVTPDDKAQRYLGILQESGQDGILEAIKKDDVGYFSVDGHLARTVNVARESSVDGKLRVFAIFERWMQFAEVRGGYRSLDYPFSVIEMFIDPTTGKGDGTFIAAAHVRWVKDKKSGKDTIEIENFATYPSRLMGVALRGAKAR